MQPKPSKLSVLLGFMAAEQWENALRLAAKFPQLGEYRDAILDGHMAMTRPDFCRGIRKDPDSLIAAGIAALRARYQA